MKVIFGGTFDPVHCGHENMAHEALTQLRADQLYFMPCSVPVHKQAPGVTAAHRVAMLQTLCDMHANFAIDLRELQRSTPSYSLLSMQEWRTEYPTESLVFLIGTDSFNTLPTWYEWETLVSLCHIAVFKRPHERVSDHPKLQSYLQQAHTNEASDLHRAIAGRCIFLEGPLVDISSSQIRAQLSANMLCLDALPNCIREYVLKHKLYAETPKTS